MPRSSSRSTGHVVKLVLLAEAQLRFEAEDEWWRENRDATELFIEELTQTLEVLTSTPEIGQSYRVARGKLIQRVLMKKTRCHVYYFHDRERELVEIHSVWGARRERGPNSECEPRIESDDPRPRRRSAVLPSVVAASQMGERPEERSPSVPDANTRAPLSIALANPIRRVLWAEDSLRERFLSEGAADLGAAERELIASWKHRVSGRFVVLKHLRTRRSRRTARPAAPRDRRCGVARGRGARRRVRGRPGPTTRIAPNPSRLISRSPPMVTVPAAGIVIATA